MKRSFALFLIAAQLIALASCGGSGASNDTTAAQGNDNGTIASDLTTENIYASLEKKDFGDAEINILGYSSTQAYNDAESFTAEQTGEVIDDAVWQRNMDTEELLGVKLVYNTSMGDAEANKQFQASVLAGDDICDIFVIKGGMFGTNLTSGVLRDWNDVEGINLENPWYVHNANETVRLGNKQYAILSDACKTNITMCWTTVYNKRLADEWKVEDPYDVVTSGKWTMDKLYSMSKDIYSDLNANSTRDIEDLYGYLTDKWATIDPFMVSHGVSAIAKDKDGMPTIDFYSEKLVNSFEKIYTLYWDNAGGFVDESNPYDYRFDFAEGHAVFSPMLFDYMISEELRSMKDDYGVLPYPKLDENQDEYRTFLLARTGMFLLPITADEDSLSKVGYVVEALSAYSHKYLTPALYDVSLTEKGVRDERSLEMLELIMDSRTFEFSSFTETGGNYPFNGAKCYRALMAKKDKNITSYYEANKSAAEAYVEQLREYILELDS